MAPETSGSMHSNIPLFDQLSANYNQDTLVLPFGATGAPQMGAELMGNYEDSQSHVGNDQAMVGTDRVD